MSMFCYQCEQTSKGSGCTSFGVCGKDPDTAHLQDLLMYAAEGLAQVVTRCKQLGLQDPDADQLIMDSMFTTVTNVNFDAADIALQVGAVCRCRDRLKKEYMDLCNAQDQTPEALEGPASFVPAEDFDGLVRQSEPVSPEARIQKYGPELAGLQDLYLFGLKGTAAYAHHANVLGMKDKEVYAAFAEGLCYLAEQEPQLDELLRRCLECGEINLKVMGMLDKANTGAYGTPEPTAVNVEPVKGKAILVSGHDLKDLEELLKQTQDKGVNIYTHGEMLPAHAYPELKKYPHLVGNYGGAWQDQQKEFDAFPGAILMTTNCIQKPRNSYHNRIFTSGLVQWPGVAHVSAEDFSPVINAALDAEGFTEDAERHEITIGFGHGTILGVADKVIDAVKSGAVKHFFLIGGCDGAKSGRNYYTEFAEAVPEDCMILTLACGKYRFNKLDFGDIGGIPRLLDCGQCNDAYSAIKVAGALAQAFGCGVNDLPLSLVLSWYEQKAVCILLTLLHLGIKDIRLGPTLPAFVSPAVLDVLVEKFAIKPTGTVEEDMQTILSA